MDKKHVVWVGFFFLAMSLAAQKADDKIVFPGFGLGTSSSDADAMSGSYLRTTSGSTFKNAESESSSAYNIGAMFDYFIIDRLAVTVGLYYESSPVKYTYPRRSAAYDLELTGEFAFLTIPAGAHYFFTDWFFLGGGFYIGLPVRDDFEVELGPASGSTELQTNNDFGLFLDIGGNFAIRENGSILVGLRYKRGLAKVYDKEDIITDIKMRSFMLNLAYGIKL